MTTWLMLNSLGLIVVVAVLYLVLRQVGFLLRRVGPVGARTTSQGPRIGENLVHYLPQIAEGEFRDKAKLILFVSDECPICAVIRDGAGDLAKKWKRDARVLLIYDCPNASADSPLTKVVPGLFEARAFGLRERLEATFVPFGIVTDRPGTVVGKGLVNEIGHMESLLELERANSKELSSSNRQHEEFAA